MIKSSKIVKGTGKIRHYHGAMIHELYKSLYISCLHVVKGKSRILFVLDIAN
ncbi:hypothetical protein [Candidatus Harpocratesius sp.]